MKFPEQFRWKDGPHPMYRSKEGDDFGFFITPISQSPKNEPLKIMATSGHDGDGDEANWEHASVSLKERPHRCPSWEAMCFVKDLFWEPEECVVQFHPPKSSYVNAHQGCLHLWRCKNRAFPTPPKECVG